MFQCQLLKTIRVLGTKTQYLFVAAIININSHRYSASLTNNSVFEWDVLLKRYKTNKQNEEALKLFHDGINKKKLIPNYIIYLLVLGICSDLGSLEKGKEIHKMIMNTKDDIKNNLKIQNALINMYFKCHDITNAEKLFNNLDERTVISFGAMMKCYNANELPEKTIELYEEMIKVKIQSNSFTYTLVFAACGECVRLGRCIN
ncbi:unnamed protein product [Didymodactylos carnosus]|uniref:Pentatricopeptide repeat-containing protein n=1 Tax=Didymodactylos carnosus TaxID=1234261 RepID=A0A8S2IBK2_9BILA|nr:unnamed protein product [Didymodactylos carnosus]CAF3717188.1 unnamed protein product [Didymodactylos carnosus]CAF4437099.1 unnamed protein product [Didymodactylos carnosus]